MVETVSIQNQNVIMADKLASKSTLDTLSECNTACENKDNKSEKSSNSIELAVNKLEIDQEEMSLKRLGEISAIESYVNNTKDIDPFFVVDLSSVVNQFMKWKSNLPRFTPFYAVKCNNDKNVLRTLISLGTSFDCASLAEIKTVLDYGVSPKKIIYANPCKAPHMIKFAAENGITRMTFDNAEELYKVKEHHPNAEMVIRIHVDDSKSICQFGVKFGVRLGNTKPLLELAAKLGLKVMGVSFHVGSGCCDASAYADAIRRARDVFEEAKLLGFNFTLLDIGGGFPGLCGPQNGVKLEFEEIASVINEALDECFGEFKDIELIAEPGRYFTASAFSLVTNITSRRTIETEEGTNFMYYVNDGVYGSFNCLIFDHANLAYPRFLVKNNSTGVFTHTSAEEINTGLFNCSMWGPTCDSMDCLTKSMKLPQLTPGDWLIFDNMGAYTLVAASRFNGMNNPKALYLILEENGLTLKPEYEAPLLPNLRNSLMSQGMIYS
jgi:ornithine decarboxylase